MKIVKAKKKETGNLISSFFYSSWHHLPNTEPSPSLFSLLKIWLSKSFFPLYLSQSHSIWLLAHLTLFLQVQIFLFSLPLIKCPYIFFLYVYFKFRLITDYSTVILFPLGIFPIFFTLMRVFLFIVRINVQNLLFLLGNLLLYSYWPNINV